MPGRLKGANVLLVTVDTLRRDRVGAYGNRNGLTRTIDALAASGIRYTEARSHVPMTLPAHASILTGLTPRRTGVRNNTTFQLDASVPTVATFLKHAGYRTGAFVGAFVLDARFGLAHGFDLYDDRLPASRGPSFHFGERRAADVVRVAGDWILSESANPWFAWVHLFDPHAPYDAPAEFRPGRSAYDAEVAYTDAMLGTLLDRLRSAGQLEHTLIVLTADHGESLGDHGETTHGLFAYDSTLAVPLIVNARGIPPAVDTNAVAHVDIVPTILDLLGVSIPPELDGQSLVKRPAPDRVIYFEALDAYLTRGWAPLRGIYRQGWKYVDLPEAELYDLSSDPEEQRNRIGQDARGETMNKLLGIVESGSERTPVPSALDADAAARLRSLGYAAGGITDGARSPRAESRGGLSRVDDDPKRLVGLSERFNTALTEFEDGRADQALADFMAVLERRPDFLTARTSAATVLIATGRPGDAVRVLRDAPPQQAASPDLLARLGSALRAGGDLKGAATTLEQARKNGNQNTDVIQDLAVVYAALGRTDAARSLFEELTAKASSSAGAWYNLGLFELQSRRAPAAAKALRTAVERDPSYGDAWNALGASLADADPAAAIDAWRHAEALLPHDYDLLFNVGMLIAQSNHPGDAVPYLRRFIAEAPRDRYGRDIPRVQQVLARLERARP